MSVEHCLLNSMSVGQYCRLNSILVEKFVRSTVCPFNCMSVELYVFWTACPLNSRSIKQYVRSTVCPLNSRSVKLRYFLENPKTYLKNNLIISRSINQNKIRNCFHWKPNILNDFVTYGSLLLPRPSSHFILCIVVPIYTLLKAVLYQLAYKKR